MSEQKTLQNIKAAELPPGLLRRLGLREDQTVNITVTTAPEKRPHKKDIKGLEEIFDRIKALPRKDVRSIDEVIGYDEHGIPS